jgi:hypothetical protein
MNSVFTRTCEYSIIEKPIFLCKMIADREVDVDDVQENYETMLRIAENQLYAVLVDARVTVQITKEGMEHGTRPECYTNLIAQAILVDSLANRLVGNFIIKFHRPASPTKLFSDYDKALEWLREQVSKKMKVKKTNKIFQD